MSQPNQDQSLFTSRPKRSRTCQHCRGSGETVEGYALHASTRERTKVTIPDAIHAVVAGASTIREATLEAHEVATRSQRPVVFDFNGQIVVVRHDDDPEKVWRDWWMKAYGQTPEQSYASR